MPFKDASEFSQCFKIAFIMCIAVRMNAIYYNIRSYRD